MSNIELWGNDGQQDKKLCAVETKRDGTIIAEALLLAQRLGKQGFAVQHLWLQEAGKRGSIMLAHWPADGSLWGRECTPTVPHIGAEAQNETAHDAKREGEHESYI